MVTIQTGLDDDRIPKGIKNRLGKAQEKTTVPGIPRHPYTEPEILQYKAGQPRNRC